MENHEPTAVAAKPKKPKRPKRQSRGDRWMEAVGHAREAFDALQAAHGDLENALEDLRDVQSEYSEWRDNLPENQRDGATGSKLDAVCDLDLESCLPDLGDLESALDEAESADLPLGYGRD